MTQYASATINNVNNQRDSLPFQEPIGATNDITGVILANGNIGTGFNRVDLPASALPIPPMELATPGYTDVGKAALYVQSDVIVTAGATAVTVAAGHITAATGGTYTSPNALAAGERGWVFLT